MKDRMMKLRDLIEARFGGVVDVEVRFPSYGMRERYTAYCTNFPTTATQPYHISDDFSTLEELEKWIAAICEQKATP
jgi:hypothetical protein